MAVLHLDHYLENFLNFESMSLIHVELTAEIFFPSISFILVHMKEYMNQFSHKCQKHGYNGFLIAVGLYVEGEKSSRN